MCSELVAIKFPDHHPYNPKDLDKIIKAYHDMPTQKKVIITTEKDAMRLKIPELSTILKGLPLFYIPIEIGFQGSDKEKFNNLILQYVEKSKRNR
jgi:tetraacyldisaccharide 4'-kinase